MPEDEEGSEIQYKAMLKRVAACEGWREVQTLVDDYGETTFSDIVYELSSHAKICLSDENYLNLYYTQKESSIIRSFRNTLQPEP